MSDCHSEFISFDKTISLTKQEKERLMISRNSIEKRIRVHLDSINYYEPTFRGQGSFELGTIVRPVSGRYDLDLGVYFEELCGHPRDWPTTETVHKHLANSVRGKTSIKPIDKGSCVRVIYKSPYKNNADLAYHIDLPIYAYRKLFWSDEVKTVIGFKGKKQWSEYSSPEDFEDWFESKSYLNEDDPNQLRRLVKYLKSWKTVQPKSPKIPDGMILTTLMGKNYQPHERDDIAFYNTVLEFYNRIFCIFRVIKPVEPYNNLAQELSGFQKRNFKKRISSLLGNSQRAIDTERHYEALKFWKKVFKDRFVSTKKLKVK